MNTLHSSYDWLDKQIPEGIPYPSSTLITGPGGAGKPLIGAILAGDWLNQGGTLIHLLINFDQEYAQYILGHFNQNLQNQTDRIVFIEFDPGMVGVEKIGPYTLRANLLKPANIDMAIRIASDILPPSDSPPLLYGSALNMLLFSKSYNELIHDKILALIREPGRNTLFTISNNIFEEQATEWENAADNLFLSHGFGIMHLGFRILRIKGAKFTTDEVEIPITEVELNQIRLVSEKARQHYIPMIRKI
jgi:hypothetical protein